jgi:hypothetical protein
MTLLLMILPSSLLNMDSLLRNSRILMIMLLVRLLTT